MQGKVEETGGGQHFIEYKRKGDQDKRVRKDKEGHNRRKKSKTLTTPDVKLSFHVATFTITAL